MLTKPGRSPAGYDKTIASSCSVIRSCSDGETCWIVAGLILDLSDGVLKTGFGRSSRGSGAETGTENAHTEREKMDRNSMKRVNLLVVLVTLCANCFLAGTGMGQPRQIKITAVWSGDLPVASLQLLPDGQRDRATGYIGDADTFAALWRSFSPDQPVPNVDFTRSIVVFARNKVYYNAIRIGAVTLENGIAEIIAMETMSARPIEDMVAISLAVVPRSGIKTLQEGGHRIEVR